MDESMDRKKKRREDGGETSQRKGKDEQVLVKGLYLSNMLLS